MKQFFVSVFLSVILLVFLPLICLADSKTTLTILYTGSVRGTIAPVSLPT